MSLNFVSVPEFMKFKAKPMLNAVKPVVMVPDRRGGMYRKLTVGDLVAEYPNNFICDGTGKVIGQVRKVVVLKVLLNQGQVYFLLPPGFRPPRTWVWKDVVAQHSKGSEKQEIVPQQSRVLLRAVSPRHPAAFVVDYGPAILPNAPKASAPVESPVPLSITSLSLKMKKAPASQPWCPALQTIQEPHLTRSAMISKRARNGNDFRFRVQISA